MKLKIGHVSDAQGLKGELYIFVAAGDVSWLNQLESLELKSKKSHQDFSVIRVRPHKKGFVVSCEGLIDRTAAEKWVGADVYIDEKLMISQDGDQPYLRELQNFDVFDLNLGLIGRIEKFSSNGPQDLLVVKNESYGWVEIPFVKSFVKNMDFKNKKIEMDLPEGLLAVNQKSIQDDNLGNSDDSDLDKELENDPGEEI